MKGFSKIDKLNKDEFYYSEQGYIIFTKKYHLNRGYCCNNNCINCPFKKEIKKIKKNKDDERF